MTLSQLVISCNNDNLCINKLKINITSPNVIVSHFDMTFPSDATSGHNHGAVEPSKEAQLHRKFLSCYR